MTKIILTLLLALALSQTTGYSAISIAELNDPNSKYNNCYLSIDDIGQIQFQNQHNGDTLVTPALAAQVKGDNGVYDMILEYNSASGNYEVFGHCDENQHIFTVSQIKPVQIV